MRATPVCTFVGSAIMRPTKCGKHKLINLKVSTTAVFLQGNSRGFGLPCFRGVVLQTMAEPTPNGLFFSENANLQRKHLFFSLNENRFSLPTKF